MSTDDPQWASEKLRVIELRLSEAMGWIARLTAKHHAAALMTGDRRYRTLRSIEKEIEKAEIHKDKLEQEREACRQEEKRRQEQAQPVRKPAEDLNLAPGESNGAVTPPAPDESKRKKKPAASGPKQDLIQKTNPSTVKRGKERKKSQDARPISLFNSEFDQAVATVLRKNLKTALDVYVYFDTRLTIQLPPKMKTKPGEKRSWVSAYHYSKAQRHALVSRVTRVRTKLKKLQKPGR